MNSAAVIGRQLRQQNTGRGGPPPGKGRQRALSHQPLTPNQLQQLQAKKEEEKKKVGTIQSIRNKITVQCLWLTCKALSSGMILLIIGTTMSVVGFYADTLSTEIRESGNSTVEIRDPDRQYHLHNLTYVGPVIMGLGGFVIVAAFVMTFEGHDSGSKVVPVTEDHTTTEGSLLTSLLIEEKSKERQKASGPYLCVPQMVDLPSNLRRPSVTLANGKTVKTSSNKEEVKANSTGARKKVPSQEKLPNGVNKPPPTLPLMSREHPNGRMRNRELMMMQLCLDEFVPSPQDIEIIDPDGCDTPRHETASSMDMEVYVSNCPITVRVQVEPRHLASMESDGLSDSDISDPGEIARISRRDMDFPEQHMPLLGRCSPAFSSPEFRRNAAPLLKRDSSRRFPLLRQGALDSGRGLDVQSETSLA
ncbi:uncharacterized protein TNIN_110871 [Trichonephila inaurata madagascariensis]|uniref:Uncharacterized protein n=1 Tax=Trichonephila inaurata madagascariensis TaxID=2747483 RepID=A0A8X7C0E1_9ARAC|nr:uncharacterized protein TNIN_110871 [Trichonephila inaurata madagascariensis]